MKPGGPLYDNRVPGWESIPRHLQSFTNTDSELSTDTIQVADPANSMHTVLILPDQDHMAGKSVLRLRIYRIHMLLSLPDPDPLVRGMDPDPDPSFIIQK